MRLLKVVPLFFLLTCGFLQGVENHREKIIEHIVSNLPESGTLMRSEEGFIYVDLDDDYIHKLIEYIHDEGFIEPPYFGPRYTAGAHISVVYPEEAKRYGIGPIEELGQAVDFTPTECRIVNPGIKVEIDPNIVSFYIVSVESPYLDQIRKKYGLPKSKHGFHITVGVKKEK